ncbi:hypothetical protein [Clavibacter michiganensis]|uniref:hypothetical protein n=1 Tax=Clavibacter michiganensis TaxID=28447 RepID=UPI0005BB761C|nr:hypothetical protein [Clavibacter michiganensis]
MPTTTSIRIDGERYQLADDEDVAGLKGRIVEAVTGRSRFVDFAVSGQVGISVLVTPRSAVRFEVHVREDEDPADPGDSPLSTDLDLYAFD